MVHGDLNILDTLKMNSEKESTTMNKNYKVYDTTGAWLRTFNTYKQAYTFCLIMGRRDWRII